MLLQMLLLLRLSRVPAAAAAATSNAVRLVGVWRRMVPGGMLQMLMRVLLLLLLWVRRGKLLLPLLSREHLAWPGARAAILGHGGGHGLALLLLLLLLLELLLELLVQKLLLLELLRTPVA